MCTCLEITHASLHKAHQKFTANINTELNDLRKIIYFRKSEVSVERISVCNTTENLVEHGIPVCHAPIPVTS